MDRIFDVASLIVIAAIIAVIVGSKNTRGQINALTKGFADVLRAATSAAR
jgi:Sec-independent protein translocase protein TatA